MSCTGRCSTSDRAEELAMRTDTVMVRETTTHESADSVRGRVVNSAWLAPDLLVVVADLTGPHWDSIGGACLAAEGISPILDVRTLACDASGVTPGRLLMTMRFLNARPTRPPWGRLILAAGDSSIAVDPEDFSETVTDLRTLARDCLAGLGPDDRAAVMEFLCGCAVQSEIDTSAEVLDSVAQPAPLRDLGLSRSLHQVREILRERLRVCHVLPNLGHGLAVDTIMGMDDRHFYVEGWLWDADAPARRLTAVSPEGDRIDILGGLARRRRDDVSTFYTPSFGAHAGVRVGFSSCFTTSVPSRLGTGWVMELETALDVAVEVPMPPVVTNPQVVRDRILWELSLDPETSADRRAQHVMPALAALQERCSAAVEISGVEQFGEAPIAPWATVVVPLYGRIDFLEHQLAQFALDPEMREVDLIYVLDSPELADDFRMRAARAARLYNVPFRGVILSVNAGYATANNLGASLARASRLLLLNSDVLPDRPGWLRRLVAIHASLPRVGALGCKLLYEDDSLQHAGLHFERGRLGREMVWYNAHYFKGLHRRLPAANVTRAVPAVTGACLLVDLDLFRSVGALSSQYLQGDFEDSDLCLRLVDAGRINWYTPDVEMYHLEGQSYPDDMRRVLSEYNRWLHTHLWGDGIADLMRRFDLAEREGLRAAEGELSLLGYRVDVGGPSAGRTSAPRPGAAEDTRVRDRARVGSR